MKYMKTINRGAAPIVLALIVVAYIIGVLPIFNVEVYGADGETYYSPYKTGQTTDTVNLRKGPSTGDQVIMTVSPGTSFTIYSVVERSGANWYKTTYGGQWAYLSADYVSLQGGDQGQGGSQPQSPKPVTEEKYSPYKSGTTSEWTAVKGEPISSASNITNFEPGRTMTIYSLVTSENTTWYKTTYGGQWAYVSTSTVKLAEEKPQITEEKYSTYKSGTTSEWTAVKGEPSSSASNITNFEPGRTMTIYSLVTNGNTTWYKTTYGGQWAYVSTSTVKLAEEKPQITEEKYSPYKSGTTSEWTAVKGEPSSSASNITNFEPGRTMTIYSLVTSGNTTWYKTTYGGQWAYVSTSTVTIKEEVAQPTEEKYSPYKAGTTTATADLKQQPSQGSTTVATYPTGVEMTIYSLVTSGNTTWYKTTYGGQWAYIPANLVAIKGENKPVTEEKYNPYRTGTTNQSSSLKSQPYQNSTTVATYNPGVEMTVYSILTDGQNSWYKTTYGGQWAYISTTTVTLKEEVKITEDKYSPYKTGVFNTSGPLTNKPVQGSTVATYEKGTQITVYSKVTDGKSTWYKTTYGGQWAYVNTSIVSIKGEPVQEYYNPYRTGLITGSAYATSQPSTSSGNVTTFNPGDLITVYSKVTDIDQVWYKTTYGGQWVYILSDKVELRSDSTYTLSDVTKPNQIAQGTSFVIRGTLTSDKNMSRVIVGIKYTGDSWVPNMYGIANPNSKTCDLSFADPKISFGKLEPGTYQYCIYAENSSGEGEYVLRHQFDVIDKNGSNGILLSYNSAVINNIGAQPVSGPCGIYAMAYCRAIVDGVFTANGYNSIYDRLIAEYGKGTDTAHWYAAGMNSNYYTSPTSCYIEAMRQLDMGKPCIISLNNGYTGNNHYITLIGYTSGTTTSNVTINSFIALDPAYGTVKYVSNMKYYDSSSPQLIKMN